MAKGTALMKKDVYCNGYLSSKSTTKLRTLEDCEAHIRKELPDQKYFFFNYADNFLCAGCPASFTG
jgi:hypothetical protein